MKKQLFYIFLYIFITVFVLIMGLNISITIDDEANAKPLTKTSSRPTTSKSAGQPICKYGDGCYRENPDHLNAYHQGKTLEERKLSCRYGSNCYRKDPEHRKKYHS
jgi:hypothetical protein